MTCDCVDAFPPLRGEEDAAVEDSVDVHSRGSRSRPCQSADIGVVGRAGEPSSSMEAEGVSCSVTGDCSGLAKGSFVPGEATTPSETCDVVSPFPLLGGEEEATVEDRIDVDDRGARGGPCEGADVRIARRAGELAEWRRLCHFCAARAHCVVAEAVPANAVRDIATTAAVPRILAIFIFFLLGVPSSKLRNRVRCESYRSIGAIKKRCAFCLQFS
jgi:hypothetical protein